MSEGKILSARTSGLSDPEASRLVQPGRSVAVKVCDASLALRVAAVAAEVAAGSVLQLAAALGALADEREVAVLALRADRHGDLHGRLRIGQRPRRVGLVLQAP